MLRADDCASACTLAESQLSGTYVAASADPTPGMVRAIRDTGLTVVMKELQEVRPALLIMLHHTLSSAGRISFAELFRLFIPFSFLSHTLDARPATLTWCICSLSVDAALMHSQETPARWHMRQAVACF